MNNVIVYFKNPIWGGGVGINREKQKERVFSEEIHGKNYKELAAEFAKTNVRNVAHIDGLDEAAEKEVNTERKKKYAS
jgi:hypothetical protein